MDFTTPRSVVDFWAESQDVSVDELVKIISYCTEKLGFGALSIAEEAILSGHLELNEKLSQYHTDVEKAVLKFIMAKIEGHSQEIRGALDSAFELSRQNESRDLVLEGRLRMEMGLIQFQEGDMESARDSLTWAETRLKSVDRYSLLHDTSLLNKAAFHYAVGEDLMALNFYSEISLEKSHAAEAKGISRIGAGNILRDRGHTAAAARHYWNAFHVFESTPLFEMRLEAAMLFLNLANECVTKNAPSMSEQIESAKPMAAGDKVPKARINYVDTKYIISICNILLKEQLDAFPETMISEYNNLCSALETAMSSDER